MRRASSLEELGGVASEVVAAGQQSVFVWSGPQLGKLSSVLAKSPGTENEVTNAHPYGPRHHDCGHWVAGLFLASPSGRGHTASTPAQIVIAPNLVVGLSTT